MLAGAETELINSFGLYLKKIGKKDATIQSYRRDISQFFEFLTYNRVPITDIDNKTLGHYRIEMIKKNKRGKINSFRRAVIAIRQFFKFLPQFSTILVNPLEKVPIPNRQEPRPRILSKSDIENLFSACKTDTKLKQCRDKAIVALFSFEGIKISELIQLEWKHFLYSPNKSSLLIPGERSRNIFLYEKTATLILDYKNIFDQHNDFLPKKTKMFLGFKGKDQSLLAPKVSRHGLKFMLYELGNSCNLSSLNTENLRHFAIQFLINQGLSPEAIMKHLGLRQIGNIAKHSKSLKKL